MQLLSCLSPGTAVVTLTKAALWTDSRYWVQAERQMDCNWELQKDGGHDHIVTCYDNAGHMDSSQIFVVLMFLSKNSLANTEPIITGFT